MADIETKREMSRAEVAAYLHTFADKLGGNSDDETNWERATGETTTEQANSAEAFVSNESDAAGKTPAGEYGGKVTFTVGNESATVNPPETVTFEMAVDSTAGMLESSARETVEFALHWDTEEIEDDDELDIQ